MTDTAEQWLERWASEPYAYLTTIGRRTGRPHRIEIWFAVQDGRVYLLSGGRERSDWVRYLQAHAQVTVELGGEAHAGAAHILQAGTVEDQRARELLVTRYATLTNTLDDWKRRSLPVVIEFPGAASEASPGDNNAQRCTDDGNTGTRATAQSGKKRT